MFGEDGFFEVVDERDVGIISWFVADAVEGGGVEAVAVGIRCGDGEGGFEEDDGKGRRWGLRGDDFAASGAASGTIVKEEGDIGAELCGDGVEVLVGERGVVLVVESEKGGGGVAGAAAESGSVGDVFC